MLAIVSTLALVVAAASLVVALRTYIRAGPQIHVEVWKRAGVGRGGRTFVVVVANSGHQATTIADIGLEPFDGQGRVMAKNLRANHQSIEGPEFGHRVEGMDYAEWEIEGIHPAQAFGSDTPVRGVVRYIEPKQGLVFTYGVSEKAEFNASPSPAVVKAVMAQPQSKLSKIVRYAGRNRRSD